MKRNTQSLFLLASLFFSNLAYGQSPQLVKDLFPGSFSGFNEIAYFIEFDNKVILTARDAGPTGIYLMKKDGNETDIARVHPNGLFDLPDNLVKKESKIYFAAEDLSHGRELWVTDGTEAGTQLVKDITVPGWSAPEELRVSTGNHVFFYVSTAERMFVSDGTAANTFPLNYKGVIRSLDLPEAPISIEPFQTDIVFHSRDDDSLYIYRTQGISPEPKKIVSIKRNKYFSFFGHLREVNSRLVFVLEDIDAPHNNKFYSVSGGIDSEALLTLSGPGNSSFQEIQYIDLDQNRVLIKGTNKLIVSDATKEGTQDLLEIEGAVVSKIPQVSTGAKAYFVLEPPSGDIILYSSDGTMGGTQEESVLEFPGVYGMIYHKGLIFFTMGEGYGNSSSILQMKELTKELETIYEFPATDGFESNLRLLGMYQDELYFIGDLDTGIGRELYKIKPNFPSATIDVEKPQVYTLQQFGQSLSIENAELGDRLELQLFDLQGRRAWSERVDGNEAFQPQVPSGSYFLQVRGKMGYAGFRLILFE